jgi:iron complex transport system permease protein
VLLASGAVLGVCLVMGFLFGAERAGWSVLNSGLSALSAAERAILFEVRLPRVLLAALLGGALTVAGVVFQALLRNPLADPYVLGVSGGASIGGVLALLLGLGRGSGVALGLGVPVCAFIGAIAALLLIERVATIDGRLTVYSVLLTGAIFNAFSASLIYFIQSIASLEQLHAIVFYLMGQVPSYGVVPLGALALAVAVVFGATWSMARAFNVMALGEESAQQLGVDVERVKRTSLILGALLTALAVSVAGMIGFVGLIVPHALRLLLGPDHRLLLPAALLGGAGFLVLADLVARTLIAPSEMPVGVVTALLGGPFFLYLMRRGRSHGG